MWLNRKEKMQRQMGGTRTERLFREVRVGCPWERVAHLLPRLQGMSLRDIYIIFRYSRGSVTTLGFRRVRLGPEEEDMQGGDRRGQQGPIDSMLYLFQHQADINTLSPSLHQPMDIPSLSDGAVGSRFVTQDEIEAAKARKEEQWKAAYARSVRTLYFHPNHHPTCHLGSAKILHPANKKTITMVAVLLK